MHWGIWNLPCFLRVWGKKFLLCILWSSFILQVNLFFIENNGELAVNECFNT